MAKAKHPDLVGEVRVMNHAAGTVKVVAQYDRWVVIQGRGRAALAPWVETIREFRERATVKAPKKAHPRRT